jgi:hypothetical protein
MNKEEPKNPRLSLHCKYKRRLRSISRSAAEFLSYAEQKLDPDVAGEIYKRAEIEAIMATATNSDNFFRTQRKP